METNKDLILRSIKTFSEFLLALTKQKPTETEDLDGYINEFLQDCFSMTMESILEKEPEEIIEIISINDDCENIKDFADILFIRLSHEKNYNQKKGMIIKTIQLYQIYDKVSNVYSFENQSKIRTLKNLLF